LLIRFFQIVANSYVDNSHMGVISNLTCNEWYVENIVIAD
jgi:hypothetical protein